MLKKILTAAVVLGMATGAQASNFEVSGYVQGNLGQAIAKKPSATKKKLSGYDEWKFATNEQARVSSDRTNGAYKLIVGLQLNPYFAVEAQYIDLGKSSYKNLFDANLYTDWALTERTKLDLKTKGFGFNLVGNYPITDEFSVFAKSGFHYLKTKINTKWHVTDRHASTGATYYEDSKKSSKSINNWSNSIGIGASYQIIPNLSVVGEYERYRNVANKKVRFYEGGDKDKIKHNIDYFSVGLRYSF